VISAFCGADLKAQFRPIAQERPIIRDPSVWRNADSERASTTTSPIGVASTSEAENQSERTDATAPPESHTGGVAVLRYAPGALPVVVELTFGPGPGAALHVHRNLDDSLYVLRGRMAWRCGDETLVTGPGDYVALPAGVPHTFFVLDNQPVTFLQTHADDSFLRFIRAVGVHATGPTLPPPSVMDREAVLKAASETGQPILGPPMTGDEANAIQLSEGVAVSSGPIRRSAQRRLAAPRELLRDLDRAPAARGKRP
jgi:mannose-6-phosphate isomerase-like protein (cupin superfamily)